jgi:hypothetical protein
VSLKRGFSLRRRKSDQLPRVAIHFDETFSPKPEAIG